MAMLLFPIPASVPVSAPRNSEEPCSNPATVSSCGDSDALSPLSGECYLVDSDESNKDANVAAAIATESSSDDSSDVL